MNVIISDQGLANLDFDNRFVAHLPGDPKTENTRRQVTNACYSRVKPTPVSSPKLVSFSREVAELLDIPVSACEAPEFTELFAGNKLLEDMEPFAMCYGGHQFGSWAGQLGDGRAINLGEVVNKNSQRWTLQLKGAGPTPYSRQADGLAVLRSSIREFLCSEAMYHLEIPTTRALSVITTGEQVLRDMFYDGHPRNEPGAVVCRVSPSFIRFGNFEIHSSRGEYILLQKLIDYTIETDFAHLGPPSKQTYIDWFEEICQSTAATILHWMRVGFVHGVMNTDNMSILGLTIDYGPYGWLEGFDGNWTPNTTDAHGRRYCFANQPHIGQWNLAQLANAIYPVIGQKEQLQDALGRYNDTFKNGWNSMMIKKLGLTSFRPHTDDQLIGDLVEILQLVETDMTIFFRKLSAISHEQQPNADADPLLPLADAFYAPDTIQNSHRLRFEAWLSRYKNRLKEDNSSVLVRKKMMEATNPKYVLRNYLAQLAIEKAENEDFSMIEELLELLRNPYNEQPNMAHYAVKRPEWARNKPGCSMLSCSS